MEVSLEFIKIIKIQFTDLGFDHLINECKMISFSETIKVLLLIDLNLKLKSLESTYVNSLNLPSIAGEEEDIKQHSEPIFV